MSNIIENKSEKKIAGNILRVALFRSPTANIINNLSAKFEKLIGCQIIIDVYPYELLKQNIINDLSCNKIKYDVFTVDCIWLVEFVEANYLVEFDEFIKDKNLFYEKKYQLDDLISKVDNTLCLHNNKRYGLPFISNIHMLAYRKDLYEKHVKPVGIRAPGKTAQDAWTWQEFIEAAKILKKENGMSTASIRAKSPALVVYNWYPYLFIKGAKSLKVRLRSAIELIGKLYKAKYAPETSIVWSHEDPVNWLIKDKLAMDQMFNLEMAYWIHKSSIADKMDFAMMPRGEVNPRPTLGGFSLGISKESRNKDLAFRFITWATSRQIHCQVVKNGGTPCRYSELDDKKLLEQFPYFQIFAESLRGTSVRPKISNWASLEVLVASEIMQFVAGQKNIDQVVKAIEKSGIKIID